MLVKSVSLVDFDSIEINRVSKSDRTDENNVLINNVMKLTKTQIFGVNDRL